MLDTSDNPQMVESALLVSVELPNAQPGESQTLLNELEDLVNTLGINIVHRELIRVRKRNASLLMGTGKAEEVHQLAIAHEADVIIFDNVLSPAQQRNWEELAGMTVIDRQEIILDIFARRAHTREATLQVELARQEYYLPRLKRAWTHLSRQRGGRVMQRGVGEKQLESDKRLVRTRISSLKKELAQVVQHRQVQRKRRMQIPLPTAAIIGYTNAGKSSLLNSLTGSNILAEDKLFATLDPTTRRLTLPNGQVLLVTDTVGFVRRLPHRLVEAFKATLEEAAVAEFLIHVADVSSPDLEHHMQTTLNVMKDLGAKDKPIITVFNKIDLDVNPVFIATLKSQFPDACFISTKTREGLDHLHAAMEAHLEKSFTPMKLLIPHDRYDLIGQLHEMGAITKESPKDEGVYISGNIPKRMLSVVQQFKI